MNEENFVQKYSYTTQISWFSCWVILLWLTLYLKASRIMMVNCNSLINQKAKKNEMLNENPYYWTLYTEYCQMVDGL